MAEYFTKLSCSITDSSLWAEDSDTRVVWVTMLAMADQHGVVRASVLGLQGRARVPLDVVERALELFASPDPYSRTPDNEGRRLVAVEGGWRLLNHPRYRWSEDLERRRAADRERQRRYRSSASGASDDAETDASRDNNVSHGSSRQAETETETETEAKKPPNPRGAGGLVLTSPEDSGAKPAKPRKPPARRGANVTAPELAACELVLDALNAERRRLRIVQQGQGYTATAANCAQIVKRLRDGVSPDALVAGVRARGWAVESPDHPEKSDWLTPVTLFRDSTWPRTEALIASHASDDGAVRTASEWGAYVPRPGQQPDGERSF